MALWVELARAPGPADPAGLAAQGPAVIDTVVLGLLADQPLHGYELRKRAADVLGSLWGVSFGSIYPALRRLERTGAIETVTDPAPVGPPVPATGSVAGETAAARRHRFTTRGGRRTRKAYRITPRGLEVLRAELSATSGDDDRSFPVALAFCRHLEDGARRALLERRAAALARRLQTPAAAERRARADRYRRALLEHRDRSIRAELDWVRDLLAAEGVGGPGRAGPVPELTNGGTHA
jgi:DNA-binding PadR family transcriptional regulator